MKGFKSFTLLIISLLSLNSCKKEALNNAPKGSLQFLMNENRYLDKSSVIACAASDKKNTQDVNVFFYPRTETDDFKYFETENTTIDPLDYTQYQESILEMDNVFNGYLKKFNKMNTVEKWVIISFMENGRLQLSDPIRLKHNTKPTRYSTSVIVDTSVKLSPVFTWTDEGIKDNVIYFEVISDSLQNLLSGTYTYEKKFQYYNTDNVILNITRETPPDLQFNTDYNFTMMGVSQDNWVNLVIEKEFGF